MRYIDMRAVIYAAADVRCALIMLLRRHAAAIMLR